MIISPSLLCQNVDFELWLLSSKGDLRMWKTNLHELGTTEDVTTSCFWIGTSAPQRWHHDEQGPRLDHADASGMGSQTFRWAGQGTIQFVSFLVFISLNVFGELIDQFLPELKDTRQWGFIFSLQHGGKVIHTWDSLHQWSVDLAAFMYEK